MPWYLKQLLNRGYWEEAGEDGSAAGGGSSNDDDAGEDDAGEDDAGGGAGSEGKKDDKKDGKLTDGEAKLLKESLRRKQKLDELNKKFEGVDPDKYRALLAAEENRRAEEAKREEEAALARGEFDRVRQSMAEQHKQEKEDLLRQIQERDSILSDRERTIHELTIGNNFVNSKYIPESLNIPPSKMRSLYGSHFEYKDGAVVAYDKPRGATDRTMLVNSSGEPLSFEAAIQKIVEADPDRDSMMKSKVKPGAGSGAAKVKPAADAAKEEVSGASLIAAALKKAKSK